MALGNWVTLPVTAEAKGQRRSWRGGQWLDRTQAGARGMACTRKAQEVCRQHVRGPGSWWPWGREALLLG